MLAGSGPTVIGRGKARFRLPNLNRLTTVLTTTVTTVTPSASTSTAPNPCCRAWSGRLPAAGSVEVASCRSWRTSPVNVVTGLSRQLGMHTPVPAGTPWEHVAGQQLSGDAPRPCEPPPRGLYIRRVTRCRRDGACRWKGCPDGLPGAAGGGCWGGALDWRGLVWCEPGHAGGHFGMLQALRWMGWRAARLSRGCHRGAKRCGTGGDALRRAMHGGGSGDVGGTGGKGLR
jgi:hypothetical protein